MNTTADEKTTKARRVISAKEKAQAVLAVWSSRRNTARVCRELGVNWGILRSWEKRSLSGILTALGGEAQSAGPQGELGCRLESLLAGLTSTVVPLPTSSPAEATAEGLITAMSQV